MIKAIAQPRTLILGVIIGLLLATTAAWTLRNYKLTSIDSYVIKPGDTILVQINGRPALCEVFVGDGPSLICKR